MKVVVIEKRKGFLGMFLRKGFLGMFLRKLYGIRKVEEP